MRDRCKGQMVRLFRCWIVVGSGNEWDAEVLSTQKLDIRRVKANLNRSCIASIKGNRDGGVTALVVGDVRANEEEAAG